MLIDIPTYRAQFTNLRRPVYTRWWKVSVRIPGFPEFLVRIYVYQKGDLDHDRWLS